MNTDKHRWGKGRRQEGIIGTNVTLLGELKLELQQGRESKGTRNAGRSKPNVGLAIDLAPLRPRAGGLPVMTGKICRVSGQVRP